MEQQQDFLNEMEDNKLPSMLNVLTILTFIGCAFLLWDVVQLFNIDKDLSKAEEALTKAGSAAEMPAMIKTMLEDALNLVKARAANKIPLIIVELIAVALCLFGAIQMRARKMQGYFLYIIGELLPLIGGAIFIGSLMFKGVQLIGLFFPLLFIILYTTQRKHLTK